MEYYGMTKGLSSYQVSCLRNPDGNGRLYLYRSTEYALLRKKIIKEVPALTREEKQQAVKRSEKLVNKAIASLKKRRLESAYRLLEEAMELLGSRFEKVCVLTKKGKRIMDEITEEEKNNEL